VPIPQLRDYQMSVKNDIYTLWSQGARNVAAIMPTGAGKCLGKGTPVMLVDGSIRPVETISIGDALMGPDGHPRFVVSTCVGREMLYRVTPVKGVPYIVNESHILSLKMTGGSDIPGMYKGKIVNISVSDYLKSTKTFKHCAKGWRTGISSFINETDRLPIDPYFIGLWLGDGTTLRPHVTTADAELADYIQEFARNEGCKVRTEVLNNKSGGSDYWTLHLSSGNLTTRMRNLRLIGNKHIPDIYKFATRENRLRLLAGILDSDGYLTPDKGCFDIVLKVERLFDDMVFLARSLGFAAYKAPCKKTCTNNGVIGDYFRCVVSGPIEDIPFRRKRHVGVRRAQKKDVLVTGIRVEPVGEGDYYGFELFGPDRLFLLGDFTVTHNTVLLSDIVHDHHGLSCVMAHRQELVSQLSMSLARFEVMHRIIAPKGVIASIVKEQQIEFGRTYYNSNAPAAVAGVQTLVARRDMLSRWAQQVTLWVGDECHHYVPDNSFGTAVSIFPHAKGLGVTATPQRADGKGLNGVFHAMTVGPSVYDLIEMGNLCKYRIVAPPSDFDVDHLKVTTTGDFSGKEMREAARKSHIVGDVVEHYLRFAAGKTGITFATDVETANDIAERYRQAGVSCQAVSANTPEHVRNEFVRRFKRGDIKQLVNVDLFGEGFDLPNLEVVSLARPTMSLAVFMQQCLDSDTEILTPSGWVGMCDIDHISVVAAFNTENGTAEWCDVTNSVRRNLADDEKMFAISSPHLDIRVTGGHDLIVKGNSSTCTKWRKQSALGVSFRHAMFRIPVSADLITEDASITDDELRFVGWFLTDGTMCKKTNNVRIYQSADKSSHCESIRSALRGANLKYGEYRTVRKGMFAGYADMMQFNVSKGQPKKVEHRHMTGWDKLSPWLDKNIPDVFFTLSSRQVGVLLETLDLGDGNNNTGSYNWVRSSITLTCGDNKVMADRLQSLFVLKGYRCNLSVQHSDGRNAWFILHVKKCYTSTVAGKNNADGVIEGKSYKRSRFVEVSHVPGETVWCVSNRLGTLVTRRNGKVAIVGNCGRALRPAPGKDRALIIDHVGNVKRHGLPDKPRKWTLDAREKRSSKKPDPEVIPLTTCLSCYEVYERTNPTCPHCGYKPVPEARRRPEQVEGDLTMLDDDVLDAMRQAAHKVLEDPDAVGARAAHVAGTAAGYGAAARQREKIASQQQLRETIALWAGHQRALGRSDQESYRRFFLTWGIDVLSAQSLSRADADKLAIDIRETLPQS
jgi:superfamily II DNA or RNA helicase